MRAIAPLFLMKSPDCSHIEVKGRPMHVTLQNLTASMDCWLKIPGDLRMHDLIFLLEVSWINDILK